MEQTGQDAADLIQRRAAYRQLSQRLAQIEMDQLAQMTDEEALRQILSLVVAEEPWRERPDYSGLVEQQALFRKAREKA